MAVNRTDARRGKPGGLFFCCIWRTPTDTDLETRKLRIADAVLVGLLALLLALAAPTETQNYRRKSSSFSVLRWAEMAALLTFGFPEIVFSNARSFDSSIWQTRRLGAVGISGNRAKGEQDSRAEIA
jgi:hypothetical protein